MPSNTEAPLPPIPSYEEAIGQSDNAAEREGLLGHGHGRQHVTGPSQGYQPPTMGPRRNSSDSDFTEPELDDTDDADERGLRRVIEQMELEEPPDSHRRRTFLRLPKSFESIRDSITALHFHSISMSSFEVPTWATVIKPSWYLATRFFALLLVLGVVYGLVVMRIFTWKYQPSGQDFYPESIRHHVKRTVDPQMIKNYLEEVSYDDHMAGTKGDFFLAEWVERQFIEAGLDGVFVDDYEVYLNYPRVDGRRVAIIEPEMLRFEATLEEMVEEIDHARHPTLAFHGHSKSGNVTGPLIYANYGAREDFEYLKSQNINLTGSIVLVKYYGSQGDRALKVKAAELAGAVGCIIYSDPADDGFGRGPTSPDGRWRRFDSLQRGAVSLMSWVVGDVLTPGWASTADTERLPIEDNPGLVQIPSLPLSWGDAAPLLRALKEHGIMAPENWRGGVPEVEWWTGDVSSSPIVHLMNLQDDVERQPIRNVLGRIEGIEQPEKIIYIGNHRDGWCFSAVDPGSGTAILLEVVRVFGSLLAHGWRPRRTIVFASWDAEEYNLIGSTEHVEERLNELRTNAIAYINVDVGVSGAEFHASGSPLFEKALLTTLERVSHPDGNGTVRQKWDEAGLKLEGLGAGSDYVAFQDFAGTASIDLGFAGPDNGYPYHSCQETKEWLETFVDPDYLLHATMAEIWALLLLEISDEPIIPFDFTAYAREMRSYVRKLKDDLAGLIDSGILGTQESLDIGPLEAAADGFIEGAADFQTWEDNWTYREMGLPEYNPMMEPHNLAIQRASRNNRMSNFDTHLLDLPSPEDGRVGGVPGREQFKHIVYGPQLWNGYDEATFPAIRDALFEYKNVTAAQEQLEIVAKRLAHASYKLNN